MHAGLESGSLHYGIIFVGQMTSFFCYCKNAADSEQLQEENTLFKVTFLFASIKTIAKDGKSNESS